MRPPVLPVLPGDHDFLKLVLAVAGRKGRDLAAHV